ncbi:hypothetical protein R3P38DRAFT_3546779 [Favolaschia claudopus]|uniref:Reverse transcriptase zinc-binding domain-containing protein n=1 Tax=Favolaschia claudopus TaxID=2862362 RepID=A0AAW0E2I1_9AGAR
MLIQGQHAVSRSDCEPVESKQSFVNICATCGVTEDLDHILTKCSRSGQDIIWALAEKLWLQKHSVWPELSLGSILGCGLARFYDQRGRNLDGTTRLFHILISESAFTIWKIRNECVIQRQGDPLPEKAIHNKWLHNINQRLEFDRLLTNHAKYGKQYALKPSLVLQTWNSTLLDEDKLPDDWIKLPRVLVGIKPQTDPPSSRPSGRRGRNR